MSEKEVREWFELEPYLSLARAIRASPKKSKEIAKIIVIQESETEEMIDSLEKSGAIEYTGTGWKLTTLGEKVLKEYLE